MIVTMNVKRFGGIPFGEHLVDATCLRQSIVTLVDEFLVVVTFDAAASCRLMVSYDDIKDSQLVKKQIERSIADGTFADFDAWRWIDVNVVDAHFVCDLVASLIDADSQEMWTTLTHVQFCRSFVS